MGEATDYYKEVRQLGPEKNKHVVPKQYMDAIYKSGGVPLAITYHDMWLDGGAAQEFDGILFIGSTTRYPAAWYHDGAQSDSPQTEKRVEFEYALMKDLLEHKTPMLNICGGHQILAAVLGCKLSSQIEHYESGRMNHALDMWDRHTVEVTPGTKLSQIFGQAAANDNQPHTLNVNSFHSEGIVIASDKVIVNAAASDGTIEGIEAKDHPFVVGIQWHPEIIFEQEPDNKGNGIFRLFVDHCRAHRDEKQTLSFS
ncbi:MAG: gamma-glutamyl-gamma-aminobutyrate hydrolase family protein [Alphaproteobacteria bacterium]|nr:gamma-glutamyl-gamma-aminobutyrate hydrolase family protein [Alphaproteobacteria bacterium]